MENRRRNISVGSFGNSCWWKEIHKNSGWQESTHWIKQSAGRVRERSLANWEQKQIMGFNHVVEYKECAIFCFKGSRLQLNGSCGLHDMKRRAPVNCFRWTIYSIESICSNMFFFTLQCSDSWHNVIWRRCCLTYYLTPTLLTKDTYVISSNRSQWQLNSFFSNCTSSGKLWPFFLACTAMRCKFSLCNMCVYIHM